MKAKILIVPVLILIVFASCKTTSYDWESFSYTAVPVVKVNTAKSALPTVPTANTAFFNLSDPNISTEQFEFTLNWEGFGLAEVNSIEVYLGFNLAESSPPAYPIVISQPGGLYPDKVQYPLPSRVGTGDKLYQTVTTFPATFTVTAAQMAAFTGVNLSTVKQNDNFLFKFILNLKDGRRIVGFQENVCDETRGEIGDCRVGVRFRKP